MVGQKSQFRYTLAVHFELRRHPRPDLRDAAAASDLPAVARGDFERAIPGWRPRALHEGAGGRAGGIAQHGGRGVGATDRGRIPGCGARLGDLRLPAASRSIAGRAARSVEGSAGGAAVALRRGAESRFRAPPPGARGDRLHAGASGPQQLPVRAVAQTAGAASASRAARGVRLRRELRGVWPAAGADRGVSGAHAGGAV